MKTTLAQRQEIYSLLLQAVTHQAAEATPTRVRAVWNNIRKYLEAQKVSKTYRGAKSWFAERKGTRLAVEFFTLDPRGIFRKTSPEILRVEKIQGGYVEGCITSNLSPLFIPLADIGIVSLSEHSILVVQTMGSVLELALFRSVD